MGSKVLSFVWANYEGSNSLLMSVSFPAWVDIPYLSYSWDVAAIPSLSSLLRSQILQTRRWCLVLLWKWEEQEAKWQNRLWKHWSGKFRALCPSMGELPYTLMLQFRLVLPWEQLDRNLKRSMYLRRVPMFYNHPIKYYGQFPCLLSSVRFSFHALTHTV